MGAAAALRRSQASSLARATLIVAAFRRLLQPMAVASLQTAWLL